MERMNNVEAVLREQFGATLGPPPLDPDMDLLARGVIDSFALLGLISALEDRFGIRIADEDVVPEHFQDLRSLTELVELRAMSDSLVASPPGM